MQSDADDAEYGKGMVNFEERLAESLRDFFQEWGYQGCERPHSMKKNKPEREVAEEIDLLDDMLSSLVDLLIERGIITEEEYEKRIKQKVKVK